MAGLEISVKSDLRQLSRRLRRREKRLVPKIRTQAINQTAKNAETAAIKAVAKATGLPQKFVRRAFRRRKATFRKPRAVVEARGGVLNLVRFAARQTRKGVSAKPWGRRRVFEGTFFGNQRRTVFKRKGQSRLPIAPVFGPSIARTFGTEAVLADVNRVIAKRWPINYRQALRRFVPRART